MSQLFYDEISGNRYILNPLYILRNDVNRVVLAIKSNKDFQSALSPSIITLVHPAFAIMLSFFKGDKPLKENITEISLCFNISQKDAFEIVKKFIDNKKNVAVEYNNSFFYFPKQILIENNSDHLIRSYTFEDFAITTDIDLETTRLNIPHEISLLINNKCVTDCIYCYADKRKIHNCSIPFSRLKTIIAEAKSLGVSSFDIQGGELFLYPNWYELLKELFAAGYNVYLSTKVPIDSEDVDCLKRLGVKEIQISLDSIYSDDLQKNLKVGTSYQPQILNTIRLINESGIKIKINTVVTNLIYKQEKLVEFVEYFKNYRNIKIIQIIAPSHSSYKTQEEFFEYRLRENQILEIREFVKAKKGLYDFDLSFDCPKKDRLLKLSFEEKNKKFCKRSKCTGNQSSFTILPNGDVTICEETYFNKNLLIGNILNSTIMEIWNSTKAKELYFIPQSRFPKESHCSKCLEFEECRYTIGVCWSNIIAAYGEEKWLYPAPDCSYAPAPKYVTNIW